MPFLVIALLAVIFLPSFWVRWTLSRHGADRADLPGTGGELARHLLDRYQLGDVKVEVTELGDHYDPDDRTVRLSKQHYNGKSLSAVAVAAHEISHAIQHASGTGMLEQRQKFARIAVRAEQIASVFFIMAPILGAIARTPAAFFLLVGLGLAFTSVRVAFSVITLPVEYDASFNKALPILQQGGYLRSEDMGPVKSVLRAAAFTYVAAALIAMLNLWRWLRLVR